jgi:hypothetical protein
MLLDSKDILFIILSFCVLWFTAFLCWFLYQLAMVLRRINDVVGEVKMQIGRVEEAIHGVKNKFEFGSSQIGFLTDAVKKAVEYWKRPE